MHCQALSGSGHSKRRWLARSPRIGYEGGALSIPRRVPTPRGRPWDAPPSPQAQLTAIHSIADLRELARRRVPRTLFEYGDRRSYDELTIARNRWDLQAIQSRQRVVCDLSRLSVASPSGPQNVTLPLAIAPTGFTGLTYGEGEICGGRVAHAVGIPFCLRTMAIGSIEDGHKAAQTPFWFQIYLTRERRFNHELIEPLFTGRSDIRRAGASIVRPPEVSGQTARLKESML
jgi:hypothetical protein